MVSNAEKRKSKQNKHKRKSGNKSKPSHTEKLNRFDEQVSSHSTPKPLDVNNIKVGANFPNIISRAEIFIKNEKTSYTQNVPKIYESACSDVNEKFCDLKEQYETEESDCYDRLQIGREVIQQNCEVRDSIIEIEKAMDNIDKQFDDQIKKLKNSFSLVKKIKNKE